MFIAKTYSYIGLVPKFFVVIRCGFVGNILFYNRIGDFLFIIIRCRVIWFNTLREYIGEPIGLLCIFLICKDSI